MSEKIVNVTEPVVTEKKPSRKPKTNKRKASVFVITAFLIMGCITILFPLYITIVIPRR